ncbi:UTP-glucose-1-phosphate uridylyltransferase [Clostridium argentinense CDC 2741]|uniref:UTP--glucose-1-phosphate uridylyltransferase n=1 Tax=Clostridium argentinense CDC 2741 TaxID=1418104 RepID=A0A0C1QUI6_9CLOT|nr:UTP--glucose-1-phosphate uridylyltransferase GalU [Clostridium argentinense]ARC83876.1 UTP--glucose-1-phosphate uridylyltransferase [Clostridium argentinense]KIE44707.1 UTP-glucose-1-phosphate uridylyltransferase [Clostridium argentinense CDC 2741]NFF39785.1 UTP--glucose-1-phosphate uridylyltransferase GalU [Clostridium argentinense]NFP49785.1 UTP--glucose-1-phosphate uridylyltransferase GalU [Clostridium argentinense]NFP72186.1 UTP--glucose-1-phosphate uridylyltransferase GalU [Clostridium
MKVRKAIILAGGFGTRLLPATKTIPKEMINLVDKPAIQYLVEECVNSGVEEVLIVTSRNKSSIEDWFDNSPELESFLTEKNKINQLEEIKNIKSKANIYFIRQKEPLGTGHAVLCGKSFIGDEPFAVILGDDIIYSENPSINQLIDVYKRNNSSVLGIREVEKSEVNKYGIVELNKINEQDFKVSSIIEKPKIEESPSNMAVIGRYILTPKIFKCLEKVEFNIGGEIELTEAIKKLMIEKEVHACKIEGKIYDLGDKLGYLKATTEYALRHTLLKNDYKDYLIELIKEIDLH